MHVIGVGVVRLRGAVVDMVVFMVTVHWGEGPKKRSGDCPGCRAGRVEVLTLHYSTRTECQKIFG